MKDLEISIRVDGILKHHIKAEFVEVPHHNRKAFWYNVGNYSTDKKNVSGEVEIDADDHILLIKNLLRKVK